jgi:hypothetical protein
MAEDRAPGLVVWGLGAFHATSLLLAAVLALHALGNLGSVVGSFHTAVGVALFAALWAGTLATAQQVLRGVELTADGRLGGPGVVGRAALWGGALGVASAMLLLVAVLAPSGAGAGALIFLPLVGAAAFVVGALVGAGLAVLDAALLLVARRAAGLAARPPPDAAGPNLYP